jgi:hypothetical protein
MTEETMCCPKCNGSGQVKKAISRSKIVRSEDPNKRWCYTCKEFKLLNCFYGKSSYCRSCEKRIKKNVDAICAVCSNKFKGKSRKTAFCSMDCYNKRRIENRQSREHELLPNYLTEDFKG